VKTPTDKTLATLFTEARSQNGWKPEPVSDDDLQAAYEIAKWGPTSMNTQPLRVLLLRSEEAKERLKPALVPGNIEKTMSAPVVAIFAYDTAFHAHLPRIFPHNPAAQSFFAGKEALIEATAFRNGTLQAAYFMLSLRAVGLDVGPMSGFDPAKVDATFFSGSTFKSNFLCGIGHGDPAKVFKRSPRLEFAEICTVL
jgi:3-hydroxypropanoate dehydrogenase